MEFIVYEEAPGAWKWDLMCDQVKIATAGTTYKTWENCLSAVDVVKGTRFTLVRSIPTPIKPPSNGSRSPLRHRF